MRGGSRVVEKGCELALSTTHIIAASSSDSLGLNRRISANRVIVKSPAVVSTDMQSVPASGDDVRPMYLSAQSGHGAMEAMYAQHIGETHSLSKGHGHDGRTTGVRLDGVYLYPYIR